MRDGITLGCDLHLPARDGRALPGRFPSIVYEVTPYAVNTVFYLEQGAYFASRGYSAITCNVRGTGRSGGSYPQMNQPAEQTDAYDLVEWVAAQQWSTGRVGQTGESYGGMMTYRAAASGAPHLAAVAPQQAPNDLYLDDIYPGGIPSAPISENWWPLLAQLSSYGRISSSRLYALQRRHPTRDAFWQQIAIDGVLDRITVPVLAFAGWRDPLFRDGSVRNYERLVARRGTAETFLINGPWTHGEVINWRGCKLIAAACANGGHLVPRGALLAWFDRWVAQRPEAPLPSAAVTSFQGPAGLGDGWRERATVFPAATTRTLTLEGSALSDGAGGAAAAGVRRWTARPTDGLLGRAPTVDFTTTATAEPLDLTGRPTARLRVTSSGTDANLHAELRWIRPDGSAKAISDGWLRASHRASHEAPEPLEPGQPVDLTLTLDPLDLRLPAGSKLQLRLGSGSAQQVKPLSRPTTISVATGAGGSVLELPAGN